eukprot:scaffold23542_cov242-Isochrysis_galbana.AAC.3
MAAAPTSQGTATASCVPSKSRSWTSAIPANLTRVLAQKFWWYVSAGEKSRLGASPPMRTTTVAGAPLPVLAYCLAASATVLSAILCCSSSCVHMTDRYWSSLPGTTTAASCSCQNLQSSVA